MSGNDLDLVPHILQAQGNLTVAAARLHRKERRPKLLRLFKQRLVIHAVDQPQLVIGTRHRCNGAVCLSKIEADDGVRERRIQRIACILL